MKNEQKALLIVAPFFWFVVFSYLLTYPLVKVKIMLWCVEFLRFVHII